MVKKANHKNPQFSVVVPVYNSQDSLLLLHQRLEKTFASLHATWELILTNDCSKDKSWHIMQELASKDKRVIAINLLNNFGQHNAIMCGLHHAQGQYVVTMDDDLQHPPEEIIKLYHTIKTGDYRVVYGQYQQKNHGWFRDLCSKAVNKVLSKVTGSGYNVTSFRILHKDVVTQILQSTQYYVMVDVLIKDSVHSTYVGHCVVEHHHRTIGKSNYSFKKLFWYALNMIFNYTTWPLRLASILGLVFSLLSFISGFFLLYLLLVCWCWCQWMDFTNIISYLLLRSHFICPRNNGRIFGKSLPQCQ